MPFASLLLLHCAVPQLCAEGAPSLADATPGPGAEWSPNKASGWHWSAVTVSYSLLHAVTVSPAVYHLPVWWFHKPWLPLCSCSTSMVGDCGPALARGAQQTSACGGLQPHPLQGYLNPSLGGRVPLPSLSSFNFLSFPYSPKLFFSFLHVFIFSFHMTNLLTMLSLATSPLLASLITTFLYFSWRWPELKTSCYWITYFLSVTHVFLRYTFYSTFIWWFSC